MNGECFVDRIKSTRPIRVLELGVAILRVALNDQLGRIQPRAERFQRLGLGYAVEVRDALGDRQRPLAGGHF